MHFPRIALTALGAVILLPSALAQSSCPQGQREHKDDKGAVWCIDSEGRSIAAEVKRGAALPKMTVGSSSTASQGHDSGPVNLPRSVRMCGSDGRCQTLTWNDGHFDARFDGETEVGSTFGVVRWDRDAVELIGIITKPDPSGNYATGVFTGRISDGGHSIDNGTNTWRGGTATGSMPFTLSWNPDVQVITAASRVPVNLPKSMRLCGIGKCVALKLNGGNYDVFEESDLVNKTAVYKVSSFSSDSVFWELAVPNGLRAIVTGKVQENTIINGRLTWLNGFNGASGPINGTWADSLASSEPERREGATHDPPQGPAPTSMQALTAGHATEIVKKADRLFDNREWDKAFPLYVQAADSGELHAQARLGFYYLNGNRFKRDCNEALRRYHLGDDGGDIQAAYDIGFAYDSGWCVREDNEEALRWYQRGAREGDPRAMGQIGIAYYEGRRVEKNVVEAKKLFENVWTLNNSESLFMVGMNYELDGLQKPVEFAEARKWLKKSSELGNELAMGWLAGLYEKGLCGPMDLDAAAHWYNEAAALGDSSSKFRAQIYSELGFGEGKRPKWTIQVGENGQVLFDFSGTWQSYFDGYSFNPVFIRIDQIANVFYAYRVNEYSLKPTGRKVFRGNYDPASRVGNIELADYSGGAGSGLLGAMAGRDEEPEWKPTIITIIDPDHLKIGDHPVIERASTPTLHDVLCTRNNAYHVQAMFASLRARSAEKEADYADAACWSYIAATAAWPRSMTDYGVLLHKGLGMNQDDVAAVEWLEKGANHGDYYGAQLLADMYEHGDGVPVDEAKAQAWRAKSAQLKAQLDRVQAEEKRKDAQYQADIRLLFGVAYVGAELMANELSRSPRCEVVTNNEAERRRQIEERDREIASGEIDCSDHWYPLKPSN